MSAHTGPAVASTLLALGLLTACPGEAPVKLTPAQAAERDAAQAGTPAPPPGPPSDLGFVAPAGWVAEAPMHPMRKAQFRLPAAGGEGHDGQVVVTFLSMDGGGLEANLERWARMFSQPGGGDPRQALKYTERSVNGMPLHDVDVSGTYQPATDPGARIEGAQPGWRMRMAWLQSPRGNYFVKLLGPAPLVERHDPAFRAFVDSLKPGG
jgi:hypothetical protein